MLALDYLPLLALGIVLGFLGQSIRALIGLRKVFLANNKVISKINYKYLWLSLSIGSIIGCSGMLLIQQDFDEPLFYHHIMLIIAIGYAGTDAVEGLLFPRGLNKNNHSHNSEADE
jgi:hypothetical protein